MCPGGVQVGEQESLGDELVEAVTSPNETFVGVFPPPSGLRVFSSRKPFQRVHQAW